MDFYQRTAELIIGTRLKRISEKLIADVSKVYKTLGIPFETSWFPIFYLIHEKQTLSVTEIARELDITHSAVSQMVTSLQKKKLIKFLIDKNDRRKRLVSFTRQGAALMHEISPVWHSLQVAAKQLFDERENSAYILTALDELEESLRNNSLYSRMMHEIEKFQISKIQIVPYTSACRESFKNLILGWLIDHSEMELTDPDLINHPEILLQNEKAWIRLAKSCDEYVGTVVAVRNDSHGSEIRYFVVHEDWQGRQIGQKLLEEILHIMKQQGIRTIRVVLNRRFTHTIQLFKKAGFDLQAVASGTTTHTGKNTLLSLKMDL